MRELEKEREREVLESSGKQSKNRGEDGNIWIYVCGGQKTREKRKHMDERKEIQPQYFYNKSVSKNIISVVGLNQN